MRICVTGRSHIVALKSAIDEGKFDTGENEFVFIGASSKAYQTETYVSEGILKATGKAAQMFLKTSGGYYDHLDPKEFDAIVVYGSHFHLQTLFASLLRASLEVESGFSSAFLREGVRRWLLDQPTLGMIKEMKSRHQLPITLMFEPFFSERFKDQMPPNATITVETRDHIFDVLREACEEAGAVCLFQPEETITDVVYSHHELSVGSRRLAGSGNLEHEDDDVTHLNSTYGAIALKCIEQSFS